MIDDNTTKQAIKDTKWRIIEKHEHITCYDAMQRQDQRMLIEMCNDTNWHFILPMIGRICTCLALAKILSPLVINGHKAPPYSKTASLFFLDLALILIFISFPCSWSCGNPLLVLFDLSSRFMFNSLHACLGPQFLPLWNQTPKRKALKAQGRVPHTMILMI